MQAAQNNRYLSGVAMRGHGPAYNRGHASSAPTPDTIIMRFTQAQYEQLLRRGNQAQKESFDTQKSEQDKQERAKFRKHIRRGDYEFCDSYFMEGQGNDGVNK